MHSVEHHILLNLFPIVSKDKENFVDGDIESKEYEEYLLKALDLIVKSKIDVVIFWGRTVAIDAKVYDKLKELKQNNKLFITVKKGSFEHFHPARVQIEIKEANDKTLTASYAIK